MKNKDIDVFILCGGRGKRFKSVCPDKPKPMVRIKKRPFLDLIIDRMYAAGFRRFILGTGYKAAVVEEYYRKAQRPALDVKCRREKTALDTGGAVKNAVGFMKSDPFFVINGDTLSGFNAGDLLKFHRARRALATLLLARVDNGSEFGRILLDKRGRLKSFTEKDPSVRKCLINAGVYLFSREILKVFPRKKKFSLERELFPRLIKKGRVYGYARTGFFIDIGTPERFRKAKKFLLDQEMKGIEE